MLQTRLWVGAALIAGAICLLVVDRQLGPWYPFLFVLVQGVALRGFFELIELLGHWRRPTWMCEVGLAVVIAANWMPHLPIWSSPQLPLLWISGAFVLAVIATFLVEMGTFEAPGTAVERMGRALWIVAYLGLLPSALVQLRWLPGDTDSGLMALVLSIFVPKSCDIGAYFTGRFLGRHKMTPVLSPKKTWEGAAGGLVLAVLVTIGIDRLGPVHLLRENVWLEFGFGLSMGVAGMLGDLAESLIKRDCQRKDASQAVPGFGGVLDVIDALIFAGPVAYVWLAILVPRLCLGTH
jgi:phosphatidate cytidylyltransferase